MATFTIFEITTQEGKRGKTVEVAHGCSGSEHVDWIDEIISTPGGRPRVKSSRIRKRGPCEEGTCGGGNYGFFLHPAPDEGIVKFVKRRGKTTNQPSL